MADADLLSDLDANFDPVGFWERKQRELVTSTVDYNLSTLSSLVHDGQIDLNPHYQRRLRWSNEKKSRLIESFLLNVPVPPVFLNEDDIGTYSVIDGKQRLSTVDDYFRGRFSLSGLVVFPEINGARFSQLPSALQSALRTRSTIRAIVILRQSDRDLKYEIFDRLNTGGASLNAQEVRNNAFHGPLNDFLFEISEHPLFHEMLGIKRKEKSPLYLNMRDVELALRYFTFRYSWDTFEGGMKRAMDEFMRENRRAAPNLINEMRMEFLDALNTVYSVFGGKSFRRWSPETEAWGNQIVASVFDAQMFGVAHALMNGANPVRARESFIGLFSDDEFRKNIDAATNTPSFFRARVNIARESAFGLRPV
jgi:hypothetical protein